MLSFSISYWDLIKFPYFADTIERGDRGWKHAQRQGDFADNSNVNLVLVENLWQMHFSSRTLDLWRDSGKVCLIDSEIVIQSSVNALWAG